jgi:LysR family glycine cleavage system transcriptional activator
MAALPPFDALIAFEATLRNGSVTAAAKDLGRTQSAVSHRLRRLEAFMGTALLARTGNGIKPTAAGTALADGLTELLGGLAELRARCRAATAPASLKVGVGSALADHWLVARLPRFTANHDDVAVEIVIVDSHAHAQSMALDVQILWQPEAQVRATSTQRLLFQEKVFPVCHPALMPVDLSREDPAALARLPIIHKGSAADGASGAEWSWPTWFRRLGITTAPAKGLRFNNIGTAIGAALQGSGVVLARSLLVQDALADGRLCRVLPETWDMPSSKVHLVRWPVALVGDLRVKEFVTWLVTEAQVIDRPATRAGMSAPIIS